MRTKLFTVSIKDCEQETFRSGGNGGQNQDKRDTGVRIRHRPSGAVGESREHRTQLQNKRAAFKRMGESKEFQIWARLKAAGLRPVDEIVDELMAEENLLIEYGKGSSGNSTVQDELQDNLRRSKKRSRAQE